VLRDNIGKTISVASLVVLTGENRDLQFYQIPKDINPWQLTTHGSANSISPEVTNPMKQTVTVYPTTLPI